MMFDFISKLRHGSLRRALPWTAAGDVFRAVQARTGLPANVTKQIGSAGTFRLDGRFTFSDYSKWGGGHNAAYKSCIDLCRGRQVFFDVGAHIGLVSMPASRALASGGSVHAFEPARANNMYLRRHLALNGIDNVVVNDCLVGATNHDAVEFFEQAGDSGLNTTAAGALRVRATRSTRRQVSLDWYCQDRRLRPDVIKIDVEGAEVEVLRGASEVLRSARPHIVLSVHPRHLLALHSSVADLEALIRDAGYRSTLPQGEPAQALAFGEYVLVPL